MIERENDCGRRSIEGLPAQPGLFIGDDLIRLREAFYSNLYPVLGTTIPLLYGGRSDAKSNWIQSMQQQAFDLVAPLEVLSARASTGSQPRYRVLESRC